MAQKQAGKSDAQVHEEGGNALAAVRRVGVDLVPEEVVVRLVLLADLHEKVTQVFSIS